jgi:hypothetical protein
MNSDEALSVLHDELAKYRRCSYQELVALVDVEQTTIERKGPSGRTYQIEIAIRWDTDGRVRVDGCVDDGGWRAFLPLSTGFIVTPEGEVVA